MQFYYLPKYKYLSIYLSNSDRSVVVGHIIDQKTTCMYHEKKTLYGHFELHLFFLLLLFFLHAFISFLNVYFCCSRGVENLKIIAVHGPPVIPGWYSQGLTLDHSHAFELKHEFIVFSQRYSS